MKIQFELGHYVGLCLTSLNVGPASKWNVNDPSEEKMYIFVATLQLSIFSSQASIIFCIPQPSSTATHLKKSVYDERQDLNMNI